MADLYGMSSPPFPCARCGLCCRSVDLAEQTRHLDRGDGTCRHHDDAGKLCQIYETRPDICRVELQFRLHYKDQYSWEEFVDVNRKACEQLQPPM